MQVRLLGEAALLQAETENAERNVRRFMRQLGRTHRKLAAEQKKRFKSGDMAGYREAVASEMAVNAAYQRLSTALGRMDIGDIAAA